jgi:hypothetical protein
MANKLSNVLPRFRFQANQQYLSAHRDFLATPMFERAIDAALLQYQAELSQGCKDQYSAMAMGLRLLGAQELVQKLWDLGIVPERPTPNKSDNLDHRV